MAPPGGRARIARCPELHRLDVRIGYGHPDESNRGDPVVPQSRRSGKQNGQGKLAETGSRTVRASPRRASNRAAFSRALFTALVRLARTMIGKVPWAACPPLYSGSGRQAATGTQTISNARVNNSSRRTCQIFCQTPSACQSRRRRQHVIPLPHPNSCGRYSHGHPLPRLV